MVKRTITLTTILLILTLAVGLMVMLNKPSFGADDIASGTCGTCSWVIDSEGVLTIRPTNGASGTLAEFTSTNFNHDWQTANLQEKIKKVVIEDGVKTGQNCSRMFYNLTNCTEIDLSRLDTNDATDMSSMFGYCETLTSVEVSGFNTENVINMSRMFTGCEALTSIDVSRFNTGNVTNMSDMFSKCQTLTSIDSSEFNTSKVTNMSNMFLGCHKLTMVDVSSFDTSRVTNMSAMFAGCNKLTSIDVSHFNTENVNNMNKMFSNCNGLTRIDISGFDTGKVTDMGYMFSTCNKLTEIDVSGFNTENVINMEYMFSHCENVLSLDVTSFDTSNVRNMKSMFSLCSNLSSLDVTNFNTSKVEKMEVMFSGCRALTSLDVSGFDTRNVTNMGYMFHECMKLTTIDVSRFNTSKVTSMESMFEECRMLTSIDVSRFDTSKVNTSMREMFFNCRMLTTIDVSRFDTSKVSLMNAMFDGCQALTSLDVSNFDTHNAVSMGQIFWHLNNLDAIKLGENFSFDGKGNISEKGILTTPTGDEFTGKWIREDKAFGPYTAEELRDNYDGSTMAGTWIRERKTVTVTYSYIGTIPQGASELPDTRTYGAGENVTIEPDATAPGYTFSGWSRTGTFEMPAESVEITGSFTANTDTPYKVEHYLEDLTEGEYTLAKTDNLTGMTDTEATATAKDYEGFTFENTIAGTKLSGNIAGDGGLVLKLYYKRNSYNVTYAYTGDTPNDASPLPQGEKLKYGADISVPEDSTAEGYTFSSWIKDYITMPAQDIEITGYFIENPKSYNYKVEYYFDGELDSSLEEILNAEKDEEISITPQNPLKHDERNYTLVSENHKITISINDEDNIINVYYETDVLDYEIDNSEDTVEGDGIPDKYQIAIYYKVENGSWDDGTKETKTDVVTLKDKNGNYAEDGTGELNIPQVGNKPAEGYTTGSWSTKIPNKVSSKDDGKEFVYSYKTTLKADISEAKGKLSNPKTDDIMHNYLLIGTAGVLVLMIVRKIRRKYSRKARKVQF